MTTNICQMLHLSCHASIALSRFRAGLMACILLIGLTTAIRAEEKELEIHENIRKIETFYKEYIQIETHTTREMHARFYPQRDSLLSRFLSRGFRQKLIRMDMETSFDMILHSEVVTKDMLSFVRAKHLQGDWYQIRFHGNEDGVTLKATRKNGKLSIDYIIPGGIYDYGSAVPLTYADSLYYEHPPCISIDHSTPETFLKSFYEAYTAGLSSTMENIGQYLFDLKWKYLTENAIDSIKQIFVFWRKNLCEDEQRPHFDLMIYGFDFDRIWQHDLQFIKIGKDTYRLPCIHSPLIRYKDGKPASIPNIILTVIKEGQEYKIDKIGIKYLEI